MRDAWDTMPALPLAAGSLAAAIAPGARSTFEYIMLASVAAAGIFFVWCRPRSVLPFAFGFAVTLFSYILTAPRPIPEGHLFKEADYVFYIDDVRDSGDTQLCDATARYRNGSECENYRCRLLIIDMSSFLRQGDIVRVKAEPAPADQFSSVPYMEMTSMQMRADGITAFAAVNSEEISVIGHNDNLYNRMTDVREDIAYRVLETPLPTEVTETLVTATLGARWVPDDIKESFRATGLSHLLCISGFHVGIIAWLIGFILFPMRIWSHAGRIRYPITIVFLWGYAALVGFTPSVTRAALMITIFLLSRWIERDSSPYNSLAVAVALMLFIQPRWIYSAGFQLSVCAVAGLLLFENRINIIKFKNRKVYFLVNLFAVPVAALLGTAPVLLAWFHRLPLAAIPLNATAALLFPLFLVSGIAAYFLSITGLYPEWVGKILQGILDIIKNLCDLAADAQSGTLSQIYLTDTSLVALILGITALAILLHSRSRRIQWCAAAGTAAMLTVAIYAGQKGVGDSLLVCGNNRHTQVCVVRDGKGYVETTAVKPRPIIRVDNYFDGHGVDPDSVSVNGANTRDKGYVLAVRESDPSRLPRAQYLIVDKRYNGDAEAIIDAVQPAEIILGANITAERALEIRRAAAIKKIAVHSIRHSAFHAVL